MFYISAWMNSRVMYLSSTAGSQFCIFSDRKYAGKAADCPRWRHLDWSLSPAQLLSAPDNRKPGSDDVCGVNLWCFCDPVACDERSVWWCCVVHQRERFHMNWQHKRALGVPPRPLSVHVQFQFHLVCQVVSLLDKAWAQWRPLWGAAKRAICNKFRGVIAEIEVWARSSLLDFFAEMSCCIASHCRRTY